jgi:hypothetical protein
MLGENTLPMTDLLTAALVIITAFYAWATFRILRANEGVVEVMQLQAEAMTRPYITAGAFLEPDNPIFYLRITNTGRTAAHDLQLNLDKSFYRYERDDLASTPAFTQKIESFPAGATLEFALAQGFVIFGEGADRSKMPTVFTVTAQYSYAGKSVKEANVVDLRPYLNTQIPHNAYVRKLDQIGESLKKIADHLTKPL